MGDMYRQEKGQRKGEGEDGADEDDGDDGNGKDDEGGESVSGRRVVNFGEGVRRGVDAGGRVRGAPGFKLRKMNNLLDSRPQLK